MKENEKIVQTEKSLKSEKEKNVLEVAKKILVKYEKAFKELAK